MVVFPDANPVTIPVLEPTIAAATLLLVHTPPVVVLLKVVAAPTHKEGKPVLADGDTTVITDVAMQPAPKE